MQVFSGIEKKRKKDKDGQKCGSKRESRGPEMKKVPPNGAAAKGESKEPKVPWRVQGSALP